MSSQGSHILTGSLSRRMSFKMAKDESSNVSKYMLALIIQCAEIGFRLVEKALGGVFKDAIIFDFNF